MELISHKQLNEVMTYLGIKNTELAGACGLSHGYIAQIRSGHRPTVSAKTARKIEKNLRLDPGTLFRVRISGDSKTVSRSA